MNDNELMHYGVLGMKWGVRRNARVLTAHRTNKNIHDIKTAKKNNKITRSDAKSMIKQTKKNAKSDRKNMVKSVSSRSDAKQLLNMTINEVPHSTVKKRLRTVNHILTGVGVAKSTVNAGIGAGLAVGGAVNPSLGALVISSNAVMAAANIGRNYVMDKLIDKIS